jgi:pimeloyl-ACP methyl ester carboxylesterase
VLTLNLVTDVSNPDGVTDDYDGPTYESADYVGISGGGAMGLITCALHTVRRCILIAPFVTEDLRVSEARDLGDAEQIVDHEDLRETPARMARAYAELARRRSRRPCWARCAPTPPAGPSSSPWPACRA